MKPVIRFENVSKRYLLGSRQANVRYLLPNCLRERLENRWRRSSRHSELWALNDVSFDVQRGEVVALIGPNGAGKTTALSILAGITAPTSGAVAVNGRIGALIKLGAGFHPDLTGRENIYLNGSMMGLKRKEIDAVFDQIVAFSDLDRFIDTPVKRYSSGMYVRLGFSVAVHTRPDILLVDEVLAVGDASFKAKCYSKLRDLREVGTTVILVSHDMSQVKNLSDRALLLKGSVLNEGDVDSVIDAYYQTITHGSEEDHAPVGAESRNDISQQNRPATRITGVSFHKDDGRGNDHFATGDTLCIQVGYSTDRIIPCPAFGITIHTLDGMALIGTNTKLDGYRIDSIHGAGTIEFVIPNLTLLPGTYLVSVGLHDQYMGFFDRKTLSYRLSVGSGPANSGVILPPHYWVLNQDHALTANNKKDYVIQSASSGR